jgi:hypothetical protein
LSTTRRRWRPRRPRRTFPARASAPETRGRHATRPSSERVVSVDDRQGGILISFLPRAESQGWVSLRLRGGCPSRRCVASVAGGRTPRANGPTPHWRKRKWAHAGARGMADCPGNRQLGLWQFRGLATRDLSRGVSTFRQAGRPAKAGYILFDKKASAVDRKIRKRSLFFSRLAGWLVRRHSSGLSQTFFGLIVRRNRTELKK